MQITGYWPLEAVHTPHRADKKDVVFVDACAAAEERAKSHREQSKRKTAALLRYCPSGDSNPEPNQKCVHRARHTRDSQHWPRTTASTAKPFSMQRSKPPLRR